MQMKMERTRSGAEPVTLGTTVSAPATPQGTGRGVGDEGPTAEGGQRAWG